MQFLKSKRKTVLLLFFFVCLLDTVIFAFTPLWLIEDLIKVHFVPYSYKGVAVLFHGYTETWDKLDKETKRRLNHGISLFKKGGAELMILSGGNSLYGLEKGAVLMASYVREHGVAQETIYIDDKSYDSKSNLRAIAKFSERQQNIRVALVSSPFHLLRISFLQADALKNLTISPYSLSETEPELTRMELWESVHRNLFLLLLGKVLPAKSYDSFVHWVRTNTRY